MPPSPVGPPWTCLLSLTTYRPPHSLFSFASRCRRGFCWEQLCVIFCSPATHASGPFFNIAFYIISSDLHVNRLRRVAKFHWLARNFLFVPVLLRLTPSWFPSASIRLLRCLRQTTNHILHSVGRHLRYRFEFTAALTASNNDKRGTKFVEVTAMREKREIVPPGF